MQKLLHMIKYVLLKMLPRIAQEAAEAVAQAQAQAAQAAAQVGQLDQYLEALRQQNLPSGRKAYQEPLGHHSFGSMNIECQHAMLFTGMLKSSQLPTANNKKFGQCCLQGQIDLPSFSSSSSNSQEPLVA